MNEENQGADTSVQEEEVVELEEVSEEESEETPEEIKARLAKAEELANNYKIRAEKAEKKAKEGKPTEAPQSNDTLSQTDVIAVVRADIADEDVSYVQKYAKLEGVSVADALKSDDLKMLVKNRVEARNVASATNTGTARPTQQQVTSDTLLSKAAKGELPESDADMIRLVKARKGLK